MSPLPHFATGDPLGAAEANLIARQGVITVATLADRDTLPAPHDGMVCYVEAEQTFYGYVAGLWRVLYAAPRTYTPSLVNLTLGNGTLHAEWSQVGDVVHWWARVILGSTSSVSGLITITLPKVPARAEAVSHGSVVVGVVVCRDASASGGGSRRTYDVISDYTTDPLRAWGLSQVDGLGPRTGEPWVWASGDSLDFSGSYRVDG